MRSTLLPAPAHPRTAAHLRRAWMRPSGDAPAPPGYRGAALRPALRGRSGLLLVRRPWAPQRTRRRPLRGLASRRTGAVPVPVPARIASPAPGSLRPYGLPQVAASGGLPTPSRCPGPPGGALRALWEPVKAASQKWPCAGWWGRWRYRRRGASWETWPQRAGPQRGPCPGAVPPLVPIW